MQEKFEQSLIIMKPDALQRNLMGEIISRFERKGLKIIGLKMLDVSDVLIEEHYGHLKDKPFFESIRNYIQSSPVIVMALVGINAVSAIRLVVGPTAGFEADAGSIRGDFSMSKQSNLVHASDSVENGISEVKRFFKDDELFNYKKIDTDFIYSDSK
ncbi:nucleoside-diphosphate kinase [Candidatus Nomurabacteria bacterium RIFCSPHIGHO2_02_FULL_38_15]|uniref:Nucleoside diphosphate kinase n=1 Tax=Candidatus Nomurabacteria bacterium RIFCSPHIGHO2_02_FULL_38_15 TaxID=1801752 RepID=A0A1F6VQB5_9BACT|nr:MAG: nucleoside-diphosphate kinase [Candidatus Nomurabacteria bacterium RIFCSPHIGHO2_02_FULL_38_15]